MIDHKKLLIRFIEHVGQIEGYSYIENNKSSNIIFSEEELSELRALENLKGEVNA